MRPPIERWLPSCQVFRWLGRPRPAHHHQIRAKAALANSNQCPDAEPPRSSPHFDLHRRFRKHFGRQLEYLSRPALIHNRIDQLRRRVIVQIDFFEHNPGRDRARHFTLAKNNDSPLHLTAARSMKPNGFFYSRVLKAGYFFDQSHLPIFDFRRNENTVSTRSQKSIQRTQLPLGSRLPLVDSIESWKDSLLDFAFTLWSKLALAICSSIL